MCYSTLRLSNWVLSLSARVGTFELHRKEKKKVHKKKQKRKKKKTKSNSLKLSSCRHMSVNGLALKRRHHRKYSN